MTRFTKVTLLFCLPLIALVFTLIRQAPPSSALDKVDAWVLDTAASQGQTEFLVYLKEQATVDTSHLKNKTAKGTHIYEQLTAVAQRSQPPILALLDTAGVDYRRYWITNMIWVRGDLSLIETLAQREDIAHIYANPTIQFQAPTPEETAAQVAAIEWNILQVNADDVWGEGITGQGAVIGGHDTGYDWDHPALINQYRGWDGVNADHDYNWHDAIHVAGSSCGADSPEPCDDHNHGTHTMGTMVGDDGGTNQIGMAPGAKWIGCRNMNSGNGTPATYSECYEWFIAPYPVGGDPITDGDPSKAPHVINNSWSCPGSEGCSWDTLQQVTEAVRAAGILTAHSAGNGGPSCSTVSTPSAIYDASFSVASTTIADTISSFSSRGPVTVDGSNRLKPDIAAPGSNVRSSIRNGAYSSFSGTSMAAPHVAGLTALLISAQPDLAGQVDLLESIIQDTALQLTTTQGCGGDGPTDVPNHVFGYGRIDALAAYQATHHQLNLTKTAAPVIAPGQMLTYTLTVSHSHITTATHNLLLTDTIPSGTTFVSATTPYTLSGNVVQWPLDSLNNQTWSVNLVVQVEMTATEDIVNDTYAISSSDIPIPIFGRGTTTQLVPFVMNLSKTAVTDVLSGNLLTYTLTVTNGHPSLPMHDLLLSDTLPDNTTFVSATHPYTMSGNTVYWSAPTLAANSQWHVYLVVEAPATLELMQVENNQYGVRSTEVPTAVTGPAITTTVATYATYIPLILK